MEPTSMYAPIPMALYLKSVAFESHQAAVPWALLLMNGPGSRASAGKWQYAAGAFRTWDGFLPRQLRIIFMD